MERAVVLIQCPDQKGIIARVSNFVFERGGNILKSDQHTTDAFGGRFFMRIEFAMEGRVPREDLESGLASLAESLGAAWEIHYESTRLRMAIAVSRYDHCLVDLLYRARNGELQVDVPCVVSNHEVLRGMVEAQGIPFHYLPVEKGSKPAQERQFLDLVRDSSDFLVMARYMQVLSDGFMRAYGKDIINIHHSFLPSFKGADPYRQAYDRGVKIIGATAHFATADLDEGPIIEQAVTPVSHDDTVETLKRKGRTIEQAALSRAIHAYIEHRIIRYEHKTIVF